MLSSIVWLPVIGSILIGILPNFSRSIALVVSGEKVPETRFGNIPQSSLLYDMGFRSGDALREINGKPLISFDDLNLAESMVDEIKVERQGEMFSIKPAYNATAFIDLLMEHSAATLRAPQ